MNGPKYRETGSKVSPQKNTLSIGKMSRHAFGMRSVIANRSRMVGDRLVIPINCVKGPQGLNPHDIRPLSFLSGLHSNFQRNRGAWQSLRIVNRRDGW